MPFQSKITVRIPKRESSSFFTSTKNGPMLSQRMRNVVEKLQKIDNAEQAQLQDLSPEPIDSRLPAMNLGRKITRRMDVLMPQRQ